MEVLADDHDSLSLLLLHLNILKELLGHSLQSVFRPSLKRDRYNNYNTKKLEKLEKPISEAL